MPSSSSVAHAASSAQDLGRLILRLTLGLLLLLHGIAKLRSGVDAIARMVGQAALPTAWPTWSMWARSSLPC
jgi:putative oxidoreductase